MILQLPQRNVQSIRQKTPQDQAAQAVHLRNCKMVPAWANGRSTVTLTSTLLRRSFHFGLSPANASKEKDRKEPNMQGWCRTGKEAMLHAAKPNASLQQNNNPHHHILIPRVDCLEVTNIEVLSSLPYCVVAAEARSSADRRASSGAGAWLAGFSWQSWKSCRRSNS